MPKFNIIDPAERRQLIQEMEELRKSSDFGKSSTRFYDAYIDTLRKLDRKMAALSGPANGSLPPVLTEKDAEELAMGLTMAATAGERLLQAMQKGGRVVHASLPGVVNKIQNILSKDYNAIRNYDPAEPKTLPEIQAQARTLTINIRDRKLGTVGNLTNTRTPLTVVNAQGKKRTGVFTKANTFSIKKDFQAALDGAKAQCSPEGAAELDKLLPGIKAYLVERAKNDVGIRIKETASDEVTIGYLSLLLHAEAMKGPAGTGFTLVGPNKGVAQSVLKRAGVDLSKISSKALSTITKNFHALANNVGAQNMSIGLELQDGERIDTRNAAMSAVAGLFGISSLVAKSSLMKFVDADGKTVEGTFMDFADGLDLANDRSQMAYVSDDPLDDPETRGPFMKQLADLQVLDYLCQNVDRHIGNMFYKINEQGKLIGIQAIDNDTAFGSCKADITSLKSLKVVSKSMADKLAQPYYPDMMGVVLRGHGLSEKEIDRAKERMKDLQNEIKAGKIRVVPDKDFGKYNMVDFYPDREDETNLFRSVNRTLVRSISDAQARYGRKEYKPQPKPEFSLIGTTDRKYTVGGLRDMIDEAGRLVEDKEKGTSMRELVGVRGRSQNFKDLMDSVQRTANLKNTVMDRRMGNGRRTVDDFVTLSEGPASSMRKAADEAFGDMEEKALTYLEGKMEERGVRNLENLKGKNAYEQKHIDFARSVLQSVSNYKEMTQEPTTEAEKRQLMENREEAILREVREAKEEAMKIQKAQEGLQLGL